MTEKIVYLDTNILSRIPDMRVSQRTAYALEKLAAVEGIIFVTSAKSREEILKTYNPQRNSILQFLYALIQKIPLQVVNYGGATGAGPTGVFPTGGDWVDPLYEALNQIFDSDDAEHIFHALRANCDYFMTLDRETILNRVSANTTEVKQICDRMEFGSPEDLVFTIEKEGKTI
jgi:hypothetical protein